MDDVDVMRKMTGKGVAASHVFGHCEVALGRFPDGLVPETQIVELCFQAAVLGNGQGGQAGHIENPESEDSPDFCISRKCFGDWRIQGSFPDHFWNS